MSAVNSTPVPKKLPPLCPGPKSVCYGGCVPGQCKNGTCPFRMQGEMMMGRTEADKETQFRKKCLENARKLKKRDERFRFLNSERRIMGMEELTEEEFLQGARMSNIDKLPAEQLDSTKCPVFSERELKSPDVPKVMRGPARPLCMLEARENYHPPMSDYSELSRFLRLSTMPGYSDSDVVSEYNSNHNMEVWDNRKDLDRQVFKMKRDWLSDWGEFNVKEQRWRKAWVEKFGGEANSK